MTNHLKENKVPYIGGGTILLALIIAFKSIGVSIPDLTALPETNEMVRADHDRIVKMETLTATMASTLHRNQILLDSLHRGLAVMVSLQKGVAKSIDEIKEELRR